MRRILSLLLLFSSFTLCAQEIPCSPLKVPQSFAGSYGELRRDHFHTGLDWRVGGVVGDTIYAIKSGYISRLSVSTGGYGNAVYITHPDGTLSLYGHMHDFVPEFAALVKEEQYASERFQVSLEFEPGQLPVECGEAIGRVGNTGYSVAPHLHLEVRDLATQTPLNYLARCYYKVVDDIPPVFQRLFFFGYCDTLALPIRYPLRTSNHPTSLSGTTVRLPHKSYLGIDAIDRQNGTTGKLAVVEYLVMLDRDTVFRFEVGEIHPKQGCYLSALREQSVGGDDVIKTLLDPNNLLSEHIYAPERGLLVLNDYEEHDLKVRISDEHGNCSTISFKVRRDDYLESSLSSVAAALANQEDFQRIPMLWYMPHVFTDEGVSYTLPAASLYDSGWFPYAKVAEADSSLNILSSVWKLGDPSLPLHSNGELFLESPLSDSLHSKACLAFYQDGVLSYAGGKWDGKGVRGNVGFGTWCVTTDTTPPAISFWERKGHILRAGDEILIYLEDDFSGIKDYRVEIDGKWHLSMFKRGRISLRLDPERISRGSKHTIVVKAKDNCGNSTVVSRDFFF